MEVQSKNVDELFSKLLDDRNFQEIWIQNVEERIQETKTLEDNKVKEFEDGTELNRRNDLKTLLDDVSTELLLAIEEFQKFFDVRYLNTTQTSLRDSSSTYQLKVLVERISNLKHFHLEKCLVILRQFILRVRGFHKKITIIKDLLELNHFATILCTLLYKFEAYLAKHILHQRQSSVQCSEELKRFKRQIDEFNICVAGELERRREQEEKIRLDELRAAELNRIIQRKKCTLKPWEHTKRKALQTKSFLPSKELQQMRSKLGKKHIQRGVVIEKCSSSTDETHNLEAKWNILLKDSGKLDALKEIAKDIASEVVEKLRHLNMSKKADAFSRR